MLSNTSVRAKYVLEAPIIECSLFVAPRAPWARGPASARGDFGEEDCDHDRHQGNPIHQDRGEAGRPDPAGVVRGQVKLAHGEGGRARAEEPGEEISPNLVLINTKTLTCLTCIFLQISLISLTKRNFSDSI